MLFIETIGFKGGNVVEKTNKQKCKVRVSFQQTLRGGEQAEWYRRRRLHTCNRREILITRLCTRKQETTLTTQAQMGGGGA